MRWNVAKAASCGFGERIVLKSLTGLEDFSPIGTLTRRGLIRYSTLLSEIESA